MKLLLHITYAAEYATTPLVRPVELSDLAGRTLEIVGCHLDPFTGDWILAANAGEPVDPIPASLLELEPMQIETDLQETTI